MAKWERGKLVEGKYYFYDDLEFKNESWDYCTIKKRSFYTEHLKGMRPDGLTLLVNNINGPEKIPDGTYDLGDGYYDPVKRVICEYGGVFKRDVEPEEDTWIMEKCRYNPKIYEDDAHLDGSQDRIVREMIKLNNGKQNNRTELK